LKKKGKKTLSQIDCCQKEEVYLYGGCVLTRALFRKEREERERKKRAPKSFPELPLLLWFIQIDFFEMMEKRKKLN
jgi:hypothetical protein